MKMIQLNRLFVEAFSSNEQLIILRLLLSADENGVVEFSDRYISRITEIPYQQVRTIHKRWIEDGILANAPTNAPTNAPANAKQAFVTICDYDSYNAINIFSNAVTNAVTNAVANALKEQETIKKIDKDFPHTLFQTDKINNQEKENIPPYNPPSGDENNVLSRLSELEKSLMDLSEENKKLKEENEALKEKKRKVFVPPTESELSAYIAEKGYHFTADKFISYYESVGWFVGKNKMKDWKAACRTWESNRKEEQPQLFSQDNDDNPSPKVLIIDGQVYR